MDDDEKEIEQEIRLRQSHERLWNTKSKCGLCDEDDPHCQELNHFAQKRYCPRTVHPLCKNHHARVTNLQNDHPKSLNPEQKPTSFESKGHMLLNAALFLGLIKTELNKKEIKTFDYLLLLIEKILRSVGEWLIDEARKILENKNSRPAK